MQEEELIVKSGSGRTDKGFIVKHAEIPVKYPGSDVIVNI